MVASLSSRLVKGIATLQVLPSSRLFVPLLFHKTANGVTIDPSAASNCVEQGAKVELPFWLAHELHLRQALSINLPACFDQNYRQNDWNLAVYEAAHLSMMAFKKWRTGGPRFQRASILGRKRKESN